MKRKYVCAVGDKSVVIEASLNDLKNKIKPWMKDNGMTTGRISKSGRIDADIFIWNIKVENNDHKVLLKLYWG